MPRAFKAFTRFSCRGCGRELEPKDCIAGACPHCGGSLMKFLKGAQPVKPPTLVKGK